MDILHNAPVTDEEINDLRAAVGWDFTPGHYDRVLPKSFAWFTARDDGRLIGFVNVISDGVADAFLVDLVVHPDHRHRDIGTALVREAALFVKSHGIQCLQVTFDETSAPFYRQAGFHIFGGGIIDFKNMRFGE